MHRRLQTYFISLSYSHSHNGTHLCVTQSVHTKRRVVFLLPFLTFIFAVNRMLVFFVCPALFVFLTSQNPVVHLTPLSVLLPCYLKHVQQSTKTPTVGNNVKGTISEKRSREMRCGSSYIGDERYNIKHEGGLEEDRSS